MREPISRGGAAALHLAALVSVSMLLAACGGEKPPAAAPRGILVVSVDALRPDRLSPYGGAVAMPALDALAADGVRFDDFATAAVQARPAAATLLTGLGPDRTLVRDDHLDRVAPEAPSVSRALGEAGWTTAAFVSTPLVSFGSGLDAHFGLFDGPQDLVVGPARYVPPNRDAGEVVGNVERWAASLPADSRWLAWVHLGHLGGAATSRNVEETAVAWDEAAAAIDAPLARLREVVRSRSAGATVDLIVVGTHGVLLDEREGASGSAFWLEPETLRVAAFRATYRDGAAIGGGVVDAEPRWLPDVAATVRAVGGVGEIPGADGVPLDTDAPPRARRFAWTWATDDQLAWPPLTAIETVEGWRQFRSTEIDAAAAARPALPRTDGALPSESRSALVAVGFEPGPDREFAEEPADPAVRNDLLRGVQRLRQHYVDRRERAVARTSARLLESYPDNLAVLLSRMYLMVAARAPEEAAGPIQRALLRNHPGRQEALHWAAHLELMMERRDRAALLFDAVRALGPVEPDVLYDVACLRALEGDRDRAFADLRAAIDAGFRNWDWIERDADLATLRSDPEYARLLAEYGR